MTNELKDFFDAIAFAANFTTLFVNFKNLKIKFPVFSVKQALNEDLEIDRFLDSLFYRKQVTWEHSNYENIDWCINSLKDLRDQCDQESEKFLKSSSHNDKRHFLAILLRTYGSYADEAYKEIVKINQTGKSLDIVLRNFRKNIYPIVTTLIFSLDDNNLTRDNALKKLELGCKNSRLTVKQIFPTWTIEP